MAMPEYSDYKFVASQAQQHEWMEQLYPRLFEELKEWAAKGRFVPTGGTWVEMVSFLLFSFSLFVFRIYFHSNKIT